MANSKRTYWQQQIDNWKVSGQTQVSFCADKNLNKNTFAYWRKRLTEIPEQSETSIGFLPVQIQQPESRDSFIELIIRDDFKIRISDDFSEAVLKRLIRFLQTV